VFNENNVLPGFDTASHGARSDVDLYRLTTWARVAQHSEKVKVSGLLAVPAGATGRIPVVSWQHGTILSFDQVPSNLTRLAAPDYALRDNVDSMETLFNVQRFAGNGYAVIADDYLGKGPYRDGRSEAYAVKEPTVRTCTDMLAIGMAGLRDLGLAPSALFLNGWSQGALNTQWLRQALQEAGTRVAATAVQSPFNDLNESLRFWAGAETYPAPSAAAYPKKPDWVSLCIIVLLGSYQTYYRLDGLLDAAIRPEFRQLAQKYWRDYATDFDPNQPFPTPSNLLVDGFFEQYTAAVNGAFARRLAANRATYFAYDSPVRFYYGLADEAIHPVMAKRPLGADGRFVDGVPVPGASHRGTFLTSLYGGAATGGDLLAWFNGLAAH
jgi:hypothetical protein